MVRLYILFGINICISQQVILLMIFHWIHYGFWNSTNQRVLNEQFFFCSLTSPSFPSVYTLSCLVALHLLLPRLQGPSLETVLKMTFWSSYVTEFQVSISSHQASRWTQSCVFVILRPIISYKTLAEDC